MPTSPGASRRMVVRGAGGGADPPAPRVLAPGGWAWRRGHRHGTVPVDSGRDRVVGLLPDRRGETPAARSRAHAGVGVIARDRAGASAGGARRGAPEAVRVADRWRTPRDPGDAVHALADGRGGAVRRAAAAEARAAAVAAAPPPAPAPRPPDAAEPAGRASFDRGQARHEGAARPRGEGVSTRPIAAPPGAGRETARRRLDPGGAPSWKAPERGGAPDPCAPVLERRRAEGCRNAARPRREVAAAGHAGRPGTVRTRAARRRDGQPAPRSPRAVPAAPAWRPPAGRRAGRPLTAGADGLDAGDRPFVAPLPAGAPEPADAVAAAKRRRRVPRKGADGASPDVLAAAEDTPLAGSAANARRDADAAQAALDTPRTTSPAEGRINRIETVKRSTDGRAGFALPRARVLNAA